ncbi:MAG: tyrosine-type recombinase/integrase, partial [Bacillota bacterium]
IMLKTGLRVNEIINLHEECFDWEEGNVLIKASGAAKERTLWLDKPELSLLKKWQKEKPSSSVSFFCTLDGNLLQDRYIREMIKRLARKAGISKDVYPHLLRYTFAVEFIRETGDLDNLQEALGHREAAATQNYVKHLLVHWNHQHNDNKTVKRSGMPVYAKNEKQIRDKSVEETTFRKKTVNKNNSINGADNITDKRDKEAGYTDEIKPRIIFDDEPLKPDSRIPIPAIKCSNCNYILRYKADCPKCGMSFENIMKHWKRFV